MSPIEAALLIVALMLPFHFFLQWQLSRLRDPQYLKTKGVVIRKSEVLERSRVIGHYRGCEIFECVVLLGVEYRFDRVVDPRQREDVGPGELYVEPGLVYRAA